MRTALGVLRSLWIYYRPGRRARLDRLYRALAGPGDLAFDIGAHVGDRVASLRRLGARVVAVEPQPALAWVLRLLYGRDPGVTIEEAAVGAAPGTATLHVNLANPTLSTLFRSFIAAARSAPGWSDQRWERRLAVRQVTLDGLIARWGEPRFVKIDVEGREAEVLRGLGRPLASLSFELTTLRRGVAEAAVHECLRLGEYRFNAALGESARLVHPEWVPAERILEWLHGLPFAANSGDIYARRTD